jgi:hypothetical protein
MKKEIKEELINLLKNNKNMNINDIQMALQESGYYASERAIKYNSKKEGLSIMSKINSNYLNEEEKAFIDDVHSAKNMTWIAEELGRSRNTIKKYYLSKGYDCNSVLSDFSANYIVENYQHSDMSDLCLRLSVKADLILEYFWSNPDTVDLRLMGKFGKNEGEPYTERTEAELEGMTKYQRHIHQKINKV